jgi:hypothetical protein
MPSLNHSGIRILSLDHLVMAQENHLAVVCPSLHGWRQPHPAAFILSLPGRNIHRILLAGLYLCQPGTKGGETHMPKGKPKGGKKGSGCG